MLKDLIQTTDVNAIERNCGGCCLPIRDRFYLLAVDRAWHVTCLRCCRCSQPLDTELSCFSREGNIYCKEDYFRLFSSRRCARCGTGLSSTELVMRARDLIFHVDCFSCALCGLHFSAGDTAAIRSGRVFCGDHYDVEFISDTTNTIPSSPFFSGSQQKGRPRKRKPPVQNLEQTELSRSTSMRMDLMHSELHQSSLDLSYDGSQSPGSGNSLANQARTKRMRTSFKHHQLRTMKSYFAINQNPDAKDLKQLAQKTGLSKRVLQVWFQNARAKWRRNVMRQEGQTQNNGLSQPVGSLTPLTTGPPSVQSTSSSNIEAGMTPSHPLDDMHHMTFAELY